MTPKEQEAKQVIKCLRRRLQWCNENGMTFDSVDVSLRTEKGDKLTLTLSG